MRSIYQSFGNEDLYPSVEEKAANMLYFVVENHSFSDSNKRIAAFLFLWFLDRYQRFCKPEDKDTMVTLVVNLINQEH